jgi:hypothetical protein
MRSRTSSSAERNSHPVLAKAPRDMMCAPGRPAPAATLMLIPPASQTIHPSCGLAQHSAYVLSTSSQQRGPAATQLFPKLTYTHRPAAVAAHFQADLALRRPAVRMTHLFSFRQTQWCSAAVSAYQRGQPVQGRQSLRCSNGPYMPDMIVADQLSASCSSLLYK